MSLKLYATALKKYYQYRCERQIRYLMMDQKDLQGLVLAAPPAPAGSWAEQATIFEKRVIDRHEATGSILRPLPEETYLSAEQSRAYLKRDVDFPLVHQLNLRPTVGDYFYQQLAIPPTIAVGNAYLDLVRVIEPATGPKTFRICDIKFTRSSAPFHKIQVAYYALLLESALKDLNSEWKVDPVGEILHAPMAGSAELFVVEAFPLRGYRAQVEDFFKRELPHLTTLRVDSEHDDTLFHLYFKCEQCEFLPHCIQAISPEMPAAKWDVSAVHGLTQQSKRTLVSLGVRTVAELAAKPELNLQPGLNWSLRTHASLLQARARSLGTGKVERLRDRYTHLMSPRVEVAVYLLVDDDPVAGQLAMLGCRVEWAGKETVTRIEPVTGEAASERSALHGVLGTVVAALSEADAHNAAQPSDPVRAHIFLYEPAEGADLASALGRHLGDCQVRHGLLQMLRMFPPEQLPPEPQYRGVQHLPASALRTVMEALFALPAPVSYDLRAVTTALAMPAKDVPALSAPYRPAERFRRPFSSRLNIDLCRALRSGAIEPGKIVADAGDRLAAMASLAGWLWDRNSEAATQDGGGFLRLIKQPFRWQATIDPLGVGDIDLLRAHELLHLRSAELAALTALAAPWEIRRERLKCLAQLRLLETIRNPNPFVELRLRLSVPPESRKAELQPRAVGLILSNDDPDLRLDPRLWQQLFVQLHPIRRTGGQVELTVDVENDGPIWDRLLSKNKEDQWFLDQAHRDLTADKMDGFLRYLAEGPTPSGEESTLS